MSPAGSPAGRGAGAPRWPWATCAGSRRDGGAEPLAVWAGSAQDAPSPPPGPCSDRLSDGLASERPLRPLDRGSGRRCCPGGMEHPEPDRHDDADHPGGGVDRAGAQRGGDRPAEQQQMPWAPPTAALAAVETRPIESRTRPYGRRRTGRLVAPGCLRTTRMRCPRPRPYLREKMTSERRKTPVTVPAAASTVAVSTFTAAATARAQNALSSQMPASLSTLASRRLLMREPPPSR